MEELGLYFFHPLFSHRNASANKAHDLPCRYILTPIKRKGSFILTSKSASKKFFCGMNGEKNSDFWDNAHRMAVQK